MTQSQSSFFSVNENMKLGQILRASVFFSRGGYKTKQKEREKERRKKGKEKKKKARMV